MTPIDRLVARLRSENVVPALRLLAVFEAHRGIDPTEAEEWRRRITTWAQYYALILNRPRAGSAADAAAAWQPQPRQCPHSRYFDFSSSVGAPSKAGNSRASTSRRRRYCSIHEIHRFSIDGCGSVPAPLTRRSFRNCWSATFRVSSSCRTRSMHCRSSSTRLAARTRATRRCLRG